MELTVGLSGSRGNACVAVSDGEKIVGVCEQERITRVKAAGFNSTGLPDEALDFMLGRIGKVRNDVRHYVVEDTNADSEGEGRFAHHRAHACASYLCSPFSSAAIVVCDSSIPKVSVWTGAGEEVKRLEWPWKGIGFSDLYAECAHIFGFTARDGSQQFEAMARLAPKHRDDKLERLLNTDGQSVTVADGWNSLLAADSLKGPLANTVHRAAAVQHRVGDLLLDFLRRVRDTTGAANLCLAGSLFFNSFINGLVRESGVFSRVFVPVNPGNAGTSLGLVLAATGRGAQRLSPFLGPSYSAGEIKEVLDNCKLNYVYCGLPGSVVMAVEALLSGKMVGWFESSMEWGPRALGARSILANPFQPFALDNLNVFLKRRQSWRGYALSTLESSLGDFDGPGESPFMECDFRPRDADKFRHILPSPAAAVRVHVVTEDSPRGFQQVLESCAAAGVTSLVNTSFNSFHEPIVCSPRDAVRVFYGSGLDVLCLNGFVMTK